MQSQATPQLRGLTAEEAADFLLNNYLAIPGLIKQKEVHKSLDPFHKKTIDDIHFGWAAEILVRTIKQAGRQDLIAKIAEAYLEGTGGIEQTLSKGRRTSVIEPALAHLNYGSQSDEYLKRFVDWDYGYLVRTSALRLIRDTDYVRRWIKDHAFLRKPWESENLKDRMDFDHNENLDVGTVALLICYGVKGLDQELQTQLAIESLSIDIRKEAIRTSTDMDMINWYADMTPKEMGLNAAYFRAEKEILNGTGLALSDREFQNYFQVEAIKELVQLAKERRIELTAPVHEF
jgi:hypothetical protein